ncbi:diacylglycerol/lipid kinase family protein [Chloroflexota bacterium]
MVERVLLVVNRASATGHGNSTVENLRATLDEVLNQRTEIQVEVVDDHPQAREQTEEFLAISDAPALVIAGGGSGTLRAVIEGICAGSEPGHLPGRERVCIAALRMGSGNPVARQFGVPCVPEVALKGIVVNLQENRTASCCIMRCEVDNTGSRPDIHYGATMLGFGQFGHTPGDLARWHHRLPVLRRLMAGLLGIERLNNMEYSLLLLVRFAWCALRPSAVEAVEVRMSKRIQSMPLLAGVVMNFPFKPLPFDPEVHVEDAALSLNFISYPGRWASFYLMFSPLRVVRDALQMRITDSDCVEIRSNRDAVEFFIDEDPVVFHSSVRIKVAGTLAFVPGQDYQWPREKGG